MIRIQICLAMFSFNDLIVSQFQSKANDKWNVCFYFVVFNNLIYGLFYHMFPNQIYFDMVKWLYIHRHLIFWFSNKKIQIIVKNICVFYSQSINAMFPLLSGCFENWRFVHIAILIWCYSAIFKALNVQCRIHFKIALDLRFNNSI